MMDAANREAGMTIIKSPHDIRRTFATNLYIVTHNLRKEQRVIGHTSMSQTMDYIQILLTESKEEIEVMNAITRLGEDTKKVIRLPQMTE